MSFRDDSGYAGTGLKVKQSSPLNAEPSCPADLTESWITPPELAFQRNHGEILHYDRDAFRLVLRVHDEIASRLGSKELRLGLDDLRDQRWPTKRVVAALQCAGNRRDEMSERGGKTEGLGWGNAVVSNARWEGYLLRPLLLSLLSLPDSTDASTLPPPLRDAHVEFESDQPCQDDDTYAGSIPLVEAVHPDLPLMLAYGLNGEPLPVERGGPLRIVAPGHIGARSVKWVDRVVVSPRESKNFYQQMDYKVLSPTIRTPEAKKLALPDYPALQNFGITSVITSPSAGGRVAVDGDGLVEVKGYALGSKGVALARVELCVVQSQQAGECPADADRERARDHGRWLSARLRYEDKEETRRWGWYLFEAKVEPLAGKMTIVSRAVDVEGQVQPCMCDWNIRGVEERSWSLARNIVVG